jgi:hypothetical protein
MGMVLSGLGINRAWCHPDSNRLSISLGSDRSKSAVLFGHHSGYPPIRRTLRQMYEAHCVPFALHCWRSCWFVCCESICLFRGQRCSDSGLHTEHTNWKHLREDALNTSFGNWRSILGLRTSLFSPGSLAGTRNVWGSDALLSRLRPSALCVARQETSSPHTDAWFL